MSASSNLNPRQFFGGQTRDWLPKDAVYDRHGHDRGGIDPEEARDRVFRDKTRKLSGEGRPVGSAPIPSKWGWQDHGDRRN